MGRNGWTLRRLPFPTQVGVVWCELLILFLAFFYSFDLSFPFIIDRLPILVFTGALTTIYVSLISIASVIAVAGAIARGHLPYSHVRAQAESIRSSRPGPGRLWPHG